MIFPALFHIFATNLTLQAQSGLQAKAGVQAMSKPSPAKTISDFLPAEPLPGAVLARVNGVTIKASDVDRLLWDWAGRGVMEDMILFQLIKERAALDKITATPEEVQKSFDSQLLEIQKQVPAGQDLETFIREKGFPKSRLYLHLQADILMTKIVDLKFKKSDYISISTMLVKPKTAAATDLQDAVGKAQSFYQRLKGGENWDQVLKASEQNPQMVQSHGALGWRAIDAFPPVTQGEFKMLKAHDYTKPVQTANGIQIFRIDDIGENADAASLAGLKKQYEDRAKQSLAQELQKNAKIERLFGKAVK